MILYFGMGTGKMSPPQSKRTALKVQTKCTSVNCNLDMFDQITCGQLHACQFTPGINLCYECQMFLHKERNVFMYNVCRINKKA